jgi:hypothetical protein
VSKVTVKVTLSRSVVSSMTVMSLTGTDPSGPIGAMGSGNARSGAPIAKLVTTRNNSWVVGVGNDYDNAIARTPGTGQRVVHEYLPPTGDTYWVQVQNAPAPLSGTTVTMNDTAPVGDRYNFTVVEILPAPIGE